MSMAGFLLSGLSLGALAQSPKGTAFLASIRGVVFDSAPCRITPDVAARGVLAAALPSLLTPGGDVPGAAVLLAPFRVYLSLDTVRGALLEAYGAWETLVPNSARLVLYSLADQVVPATGVREYGGCPWT